MLGNSGECEERDRTVGSGVVVQFLCESASSFFAYYTRRDLTSTKHIEKACCWRLSSIVSKENPKYRDHTEDCRVHQPPKERTSDRSHGKQRNDPRGIQLSKRRTITSFTFTPSSESLNTCDHCWKRHAHLVSTALILLHLSLATPRKAHASGYTTDDKTRASVNKIATPPAPRHICRKGIDIGTSTKERKLAIDDIISPWLVQPTSGSSGRGSAAGSSWHACHSPKVCPTD